MLRPDACPFSAYPDRTFSTAATEKITHITDLEEKLECANQIRDALGREISGLQLQLRTMTEGEAARLDLTRGRSMHSLELRRCV
jgi:hypothetical protein